jgi:hypothetical protein
MLAVTMPVVTLAVVTAGTLQVAVTAGMLQPVNSATARGTVLRVVAN